MSTVPLTYTQGETTTTTATVSNSVKAGFSFGAQGTIFNGSVTFEYTYTWGRETSTMASNSKTLRQAIPVTVHTGKIYKTVLSGVTKEINVPFTATIDVSGKSETWFETQVQG